MEKSINRLRNEAHALDERRKELLSKLDRIVSQSEGAETESVEKSDRLAQAQLLKRRCLEVDVKFSIQRTEDQERALKEANTQLEELDQLGPQSPLLFLFFPPEKRGHSTIVVLFCRSLGESTRLL